jgi:hypothetical protein
MEPREEEVVPGRLVGNSRSRRSPTESTSDGGGGKGSGGNDGRGKDEVEGVGSLGLPLRIGSLNFRLARIWAWAQNGVFEPRRKLWRRTQIFVASSRQCPENFRFGL